MDKPIRLTQALRLTAKSRMAIVGAGGKTTLMFRLAREAVTPVIVSTTTHLSVEQVDPADRHVIVRSLQEIEDLFKQGISGVTLITGSLTGEKRLESLPPDLLARLEVLAGQAHLPVLLEADGSRRLPLKAPAEHEPVIPAWINQVVVAAGLSALGHPLDGGFVHRPEIFARLSGLNPGESVSPGALAAVLTSPLGGLKNIPPGAQKLLMLNQADTDDLQATAGWIANQVKGFYDAVIVTQLLDEQRPVKAVVSTVAGVVLAAGKSSRMGGVPKVLLDWLGETFVHKAARTALQAGLSPVVVVSGADAGSVEHAVADLALKVVENKVWAEGQSTSLIAGLNAIPPACAGVIFLLADQPQVTAEVLQALVEQHCVTLAPIIAPLVEGHRANPVFFDRETFPALLSLKGDTGGRAVFAQFPVQWLPWSDPLLLLDVDTPEDLQKLITAYEACFDTRTDST